MGRRLSLTDGLYISVSQLKCWLKCPRQYALKYVRGIEPAFVPLALAFGSAFHEALAAFYSEVKATGEPLQLNYMGDVFRDAWDRASSGPVPLQRDESDDPGELPLKASNMLAAFHEYAVPVVANQKVEAIEQPFAMTICDPDSGEQLEEQLVGVIDLIVREGERRVIVEHKTAARKYSQETLCNDPQPTAYRAAARTMGLGEAGVRYQVVTKTKVPAVQVENVVRGERDEEDLLRTVLGVLRGVDAGVDFPIRGGQCRSCPYAHVCQR